MSDSKLNRRNFIKNASLAPGGILLYPEAHGSMFIVEKTETDVNRKTLGGVGFVFLRGENSGFD